MKKDWVASHQSFPVPLKQTDPCAEAKDKNLWGETNSSLLLQRNRALGWTDGQTCVRRHVIQDVAYRCLRAKQSHVYVLCKLKSYQSKGQRTRNTGRFAPIWSQRPKNGNEVGAVALVLDSKGSITRDFNSQGQKKIDDQGQRILLLFVLPQR